MKRLALYLIFSVVLNFFIISNGRAQFNYLAMNDAVFMNQLNAENILSIIEELDKEWEKKESIRYFERIKQISQFAETSLLNEDKNNVMYSVIFKGIKKPIDDLVISIDAFPIKRDLCLLLMNQRITSIIDKKNYSAMRTKYASFLVDYLVQLKSKIIKNYKLQVVYLNVSPPITDLNQPFFSGMDPDIIQDEKIKKRYLAEIEQNKKKKFINQQQVVLRRNVQFLEPSIKEYLKYQFMNQPLSNKELDVFVKKINF